MGVRNTAAEGKAALFDSVTGLAFGPVFDSEEEADDFTEWFADEAPRDLRALTNDELEAAVAAWRAARGS